MGYNDELKHYGVLGMKWGQHRAKVNSAKAAKYGNKATRIENKHVARAGGRKAYNYTKNQSTGKAIAKSMLFGTYGAAKYNQSRAAGMSRGRSAVSGVTAAASNAASGGLHSVVAPRARASQYKQPTNKKKKKK